MRKNVASQTVGAQMVSATDGSAFTGAVTVSVTGDGGTQATGSVGAGACTHEGNGYHSYAPAQAETNYDHVAFTFIGTGAIPATVQIYTGFPQTGDAFVRLGAPAGASIAADIAVIEGQTDDIGVAGAGLTAISSTTPDVLVNTTIATVNSQTEFVLTAGAPDNTAYPGMACIFTDQTTAEQKSVCFASSYVGSTKTLTLESAPGFTIVAGDSIAIMAAGGSTTVPVPAALTGTQTFNMTGNVTGNLSGSVGSVTGAVGSVTGAVGSVAGAVGSVTGNVGGNVVGSVGSVTGAVGSVTGNVGGNVTGSVGSLATQAKADVNTEVVDALAVDVVADSIPADGSRPTIAQAAYMLTQFMLERSVSGTTCTVAKADGTTALFTLTLSDATTPVSITRAT